MKDEYFISADYFKFSTNFLKVEIIKMFPEPILMFKKANFANFISLPPRSIFSLPFMLAQQY